MASSKACVPLARRREAAERLEYKSDNRVVVGVDGVAVVEVGVAVVVGLGVVRMSSFQQVD